VEHEYERARLASLQIYRPTEDAEGMQRSALAAVFSALKNSPYVPSIHLHHGRAEPTPVEYTPAAPGSHNGTQHLPSNPSISGAQTPRIEPHARTLAVTAQVLAELTALEHRCLVDDMEWVLGVVAGCANSSHRDAADAGLMPTSCALRGSCVNA
jgi:hypothetical protein